LDLQRNIKEIALYDLQKSWIDAHDCTCLDRQILKNAIQDGKLAWQRLPEDLRHDADFARSIPLFSAYVDRELEYPETIEAENARSILGNIPVLRQERTMWLRFLDSTRESATVLDDHMRSDRLITDYAPAEIQSDFELMLRAV